jgi:hypothetical protein
MRFAASLALDRPEGHADTLAVRLLPFLFLSLMLGCASTPATTPQREVEQFVIAVRACVPAWFLTPPSLEPDSLFTTATLVASEDFRTPLMAPYRCVLAAGSDCVAIRECYGLVSSATSGPCAGATPHCDESTLLLCVPASGSSPTQIGRVDCTRDGLTCLEVDLGGSSVARCATQRCDGSMPLHCDGTASVSCDGTFEVRQEAPTGTRCSEVGGFVHFVGAGAPCTATGCLDDVAIDCDPETGRTRAEIDCGALGQMCSQSSFVHCFQETADCGSPFPICATTDVVRYCGTDGHPHEYDCAAHGFSGCEETFDPSRGLTLGGCAPTGARF